MRGWIALGFASLVCVHSIAAADAHWSRIASPNFEIYTTANERDARATLLYFEQVRGFFDQMMPHPLEKPSQVRIVAFSSLKEFEPYRFNEYATAYYHATGDHDYIVMSHAGAETFPTAIHEYVHLVARHSQLNLPPWLNEGIAEMYSTLAPRGEKILIGALIPGRYQALLREKWVPLETIMAAGPDSPFYNEKDKAGSLYNESWALTHMLALTSEYRPRFSQVVAAISGGTPSADALEQIYGKPLNAIEADLIRYLRGGRFQGVLIPAKLEKVDEDLKSEPADEIDVALLLSEVSDRPGREKDTRATIEGLIAKSPNRPEPYIDLAYLEWRQRQLSEARDHFAKAFDLGSRNPRMLWDYGRMAESADVSKSKQALGELLIREPDRMEVRLELAAVELRSHAAKEALETLAPVKKVTPADAAKLLTLLAYANLDAGDREMARNAATQLKAISTSLEDRARADRILEFLAGSRPDSAKPALTSGPDAAPVLKRRDAAVEPSPPVVRRPSFTGLFVELHCPEQAGEPARIVMETAEGRKLLAIDNPTKLAVNGKSGDRLELSCGLQERVRIRIEYDPPGSELTGIDGVVRVIHFEP